jgi:hypothetical protein
MIDGHRLLDQQKLMRVKKMSLTTQVIVKKEDAAINRGTPGVWSRLRALLFDADID